MTKADIA
jgi:hypothetical protein